jgi:hypothetical protein
VIDLLPEQKEIEDLGGTMRLGAQAVELADGTRARESTARRSIHERHRHRYEVNNRTATSSSTRASSSRDVPGGPARRDRRAARPPVVRREPVPPGVQVAPDAAGAALPRVRRGRARRPRPARRATAAAVGRSRMPPVQQPLTSPLVDLFLELCAIPSPPGEERAVADRVTRELDAIGLEWHEDDAGRALGSTTGNVLCRSRRGPTRDAALLSAPTRHRPARRAARARARRDGIVRNAAARSSARTTSPPSS